MIRDVGKEILQTREPKRWAGEEEMYLTIVAVTRVHKQDEYCKR